MQNIIHLLALVRIDSQHDERLIPAVIQALANWVGNNQGYVIAIEPPQIMVCLPDAGQALECLHALMNEGDQHGFELAAGVVQAIRSSDRIPRSPNDFTERTLETLLELSGAAGPQQVAISPKLMSLLHLAVPDYAAWFDNAARDDARHVTRVRQMQVLHGARLPRYEGAIRICQP